MTVGSFHIFLLIAAIIFILILFRRAKKGGEERLTQRQISLRGVRIYTKLFKEIPLLCLLADEENFGLDFKNKEVPDLPHCEGCQCQKESFVYHSREWFSDKIKRMAVSDSDIGTLNANERRYYKYKLLGAHPDLEEEKRKNYDEFLESLKVSEQFKEKVQNHLNPPSIEKSPVS